MALVVGGILVAGGSIFASGEKTPPENPPAAVASAAPNTVTAEDDGSALLKACMDADNTVSDDWVEVIQHHRAKGTFQEGEFHDHLKAMVDACRPILPAFVTSTGNARKDRVGRHCQMGYRLRVQAYQEMMDGMADSANADTLVKAMGEMTACNKGLNALAAGGQ